MAENSKLSDTKYKFFNQNFYKKFLHNKIFKKTAFAKQIFLWNIEELFFSQNLQSQFKKIIIKDKYSTKLTFSNKTFRTKPTNFERTALKRSASGRLR